MCKLYFLSVPVTFSKSHWFLLEGYICTGQFLRCLHTKSCLSHSMHFVTKKQRHGSLVKPRAIHKAIEEAHFPIREVGLLSTSSF